MLGPVPGVIGTLQALECIKILSGIGCPLSQVRIFLPAQFSLNIPSICIFVLAVRREVVGGVFWAVHRIINTLRSRLHADSTGV